MGESRRGFTIIEMIVVIVFLGLLVLLFVVQKTNLDAMGRDDTRKTAINAMYFALEESFYKSHGYYPEENHVGYVTNGVHFPTWVATGWLTNIYGNYLNPGFMADQSNEAMWQGIYDCPDEELWQERLVMKKNLIHYIKNLISL